MNRHTNVSFSEHYIQIPPNAFPTGLWDRQFLARLKKDISRMQNGSSPKSWVKKFKKYSIVSRGHISYYKNEFSMNANALAEGNIYGLIFSEFLCKTHPKTADFW